MYVYVRIICTCMYVCICIIMCTCIYVPVRMFWKAVSTLVESSAEVSMKDRVFFSVGIEGVYDIYTMYSAMHVCYMAHLMHTMLSVSFMCTIP